jgi:RHS repeat-associated protein
MQTYSPPCAYSGDSTQLLYLRARQYSPNSGRFLTKDIWEGDANNPLSYNRWNYGFDNPVNYTDPSGLLPCPWNAHINSCNIYDWYNWYFGPLYHAAGINTNLYMPTSSGNVSLTGAVTSEYLLDVKPLAITYQVVSETGLSFFPGNPYDLAKAISGTNIMGGTFSPKERRAMAFWGLLGFGDCIPGLNFLPDGPRGGAYSSSGVTVSKYENRFLSTVDNFIEKTLKLHPRTSFGSTWKAWFNAASHDAAIADNLLLASQGDELVGVLRIQNGGNEYSDALRLMDIEALNSNVSTALIREAGKESIDRGLHGMYGFVTTAEGASFATRTGGRLLNPNSRLYYWDLETIYKLLSQ